MAQGHKDIRLIDKFFVTFVAQNAKYAILPLK
jgi:hypothetical protein